jgi:hypothetical protein
MGLMYNPSASMPQTNRQSGENDGEQGGEAPEEPGPSGRHRLARARAAGGEPTGEEGGR